MRSEPCLCGGILTASAKEAIPMVVRDHNASLLHRAWRLGREGPTGGLRRRDMSVSGPVASVPPSPDSREVPGG